MLFFIITFLIIIAICQKEIKISKANPIPKFENGDKYFVNIKMYKTRSIIK